MEKSAIMSRLTGRAWQADTPPNLSVAPMQESLPFHVAAKLV